MPVDISTPWVHGPNVLEALSSGASAGASAGHLEQESTRLGMEAVRMRQNAALQQAQLQQSAEQAQMEFAARQKLAEQNQLREEQRLNIENAYKTSALGIARGRLEQQQAAADEKAKAAALTFQDERGFAQHLSSGGSVLEGLQKFPRVSSSYLSAVTHATQDDNKPIHVGDTIVRRQSDGSYKEEYRAPNSQKPIKIGKSLVRVNPDGTVNVIYGSNEASPDIMGAANPTSEPPPAPGLFSRIKNVFSPTAPAAAPTSKDKSSPKEDDKLGHPKTGDVRGGYRFKGGDPSNQDNWELNE